MTEAELIAVGPVERDIFTLTAKEPEPAVAVEQAVAVVEQPPPPVVTEGPGALLNAIVQMASDPSVDADKLEKLLAMQERMEARQAERQFNEAYARLSHDLPRIKKDGGVEYKGKEAFRFATWENIDRVIRPMLQAEGFALSFDTSPRTGEGGGIVITGTLSHIAGHKRTASIPLALDNSGGKNNIQGMGSTFSYGKRYTATALLNIVTEGDDDDGKRGGTKYITAEEADELADLAKKAGRPEGILLDRMFAGTIRSFDELERGAGYLAVKSTLDQIIKAQAKKS